MDRICSLGFSITCKKSRAGSDYSLDMKFDRSANVTVQHNDNHVSSKECYPALFFCFITPKNLSNHVGTKHTGWYDSYRPSVILHVVYPGVI